MNRGQSIIEYAVVLAVWAVAVTFVILTVKGW